MRYHKLDDDQYLNLGGGPIRRVIFEPKTGTATIEYGPQDIRTVAGPSAKALRMELDLLCGSAPPPPDADAGEPDVLPVYRKPQKPRKAV